MSELESRPDDIEFVQYLRPHGKKTLVLISLTDLGVPEAEWPEWLAKVKELKEAGYEFSCEQLANNMAAFYIDKGDEDLRAFQACDNGPQVLEAVKQLITDGHRNWKEGINLWEEEDG